MAEVDQTIDGNLLVAKSLAHFGVEHMFDVVGIPVTSFVNRAISLGIRFITFHNEQSAGYAAFGLFNSAFSTHGDPRRSEPDPRLATSTDGHPFPTTTHGPRWLETHPPMVPRRSEATHSDLTATHFFFLWWTHIFKVTEVIKELKEVDGILAVVVVVVVVVVENNIFFVVKVRRCKGQNLFFLL